MALNISQRRKARKMSSQHRRLFAPQENGRWRISRPQTTQAAIQQDQRKRLLETTRQPVYDAWVRPEMSATVKETVIEMIRRMPEDATVTDIMAELYVRQKIDVGLQQLDAGETFTQEEVEQRLSQWLS